MKKLFSKGDLIKCGITTSGSWIDLFRKETKWFKPLGRSAGRRDRLVDLNMATFLYIHHRTRSFGFLREMYKELFVEIVKQPINQKTFYILADQKSTQAVCSVWFDIETARQSVVDLLKHLD